MEVDFVTYEGEGSEEDSEGIEGRYIGFIVVGVFIGIIFGKQLEDSGLLIFVTVGEDGYIVVKIIYIFSVEGTVDTWDIDSKGDNEEGVMFEEV